MKKFVLSIILLVCVVIAYHNSFQGRFVFDGRMYIEHDQGIRRVWPVIDVIKGSTRPLIRLSFALNYLVNKVDVFGYHLVNLIIHMAAALVLFALVRRTLRSPRLAAMRFPADWIAFAAALLWAVHPLQTQSVTYIFQRAESMMGLFYLLTLYAASRGMGGGRHQTAWFAASCAFCFIGMGCKAIMITAPLMVLFYDRAFWASSWREVLRKRSFLYPVLAASWLVLVLIAMGRHESRFTAGFDLKYITPLEYLEVQPGVILHYLKLSFWPFPLVLDHGWPFALDLGGVMPSLAVAAMALATVWVSLRRPALGFPGVWFFLILIPTSSFFPLADPIEEHRMYLPLAGVLLAAVLAAWYLARRYLNRPARSLLLASLFIACAVFFVFSTVSRNKDYHSRFRMWQDVVSKRPRNPRGHEVLAGILREKGEFRKAVFHYKQALLHRSFDDLQGEGEAYDQYNFANDLWDKEDTDSAIEYYGTALHLKRNFPEARNNLAVALAAKGRMTEALTQLMQAHADDPRNIWISKNLQDVLQCLSLGYLPPE